MTEGKLPGYESPQSFEALPDGFNFKARIMRCSATDRLYHEYLANHDLGAVVNQAQTVIEESVSSGQWSDAYEMQGWLAEHQEPIDDELQQELGRAIIEWGVFGFATFYSADVPIHPDVRPAELIDFYRFMERHFKAYPSDEPWVQQARQTHSQTIINFMLARPSSAQYELVSAQYDIDAAPRGRISFLSNIVSQHAVPDTLPELFKQRAAADVSQDPRKSLQVAALGYGSALLTAEDVGEVFEDVLQRVNIAKLIESNAEQDHTTYDWDSSNYWLEVDPKFLASEVEHIVPNARQRAEEVISRRRVELISSKLEGLREQPGEWNELELASKNAHKLGLELEAPVLERLVDLCAYRAPIRKPYGQTVGLDARLVTLLRLSQRNQIDYEQLLGAMIDISDRYGNMLDEATTETKREDYENDQDYWDARISKHVRRENAGRHFVINLVAGLSRYGREDPSIAERPMSELLDVHQLIRIIDGYIEYQIEPSRAKITDERKRLVTTYRNDEFEPAKRTEFDLKVRHPERGPRSMIYKNYLDLASLDVTMTTLKEALASETIGGLIEWWRRYDNLEIVAYFPRY